MLQVPTPYGPPSSRGRSCLPKFPQPPQIVPPAGKQVLKRSLGDSSYSNSGSMSQHLNFMVYLLLLQQLGSVSGRKGHSSTGLPHLSLGPSFNNTGRGIKKRLFLLFYKLQPSAPADSISYPGSQSAYKAPWHEDWNLQ